VENDSGPLQSFTMLPAFQPSISIGCRIVFGICFYSFGFFFGFVPGVICMSFAGCRMVSA